MKSFNYQVQLPECLNSWHEARQILLFSMWNQPHNKAAEAEPDLPERNQYSEAKHLWLPWENLVNEPKIYVGEIKPAAVVCYI